MYSFFTVRRHAQRGDATLCLFVHLSVRDV